MQTPSDTIEMYLLAKDGNRPHLIERAFAGGALLRMDVRQGEMDFPPVAHGRDAIAETLVRRGRVRKAIAENPPPRLEGREKGLPHVLGARGRKQQQFRLGADGQGSAIEQHLPDPVAERRSPRFRGCENG